MATPVPQTAASSPQKLTEPPWPNSANLLVFGRNFQPATATRKFLEESLHCAQGFMSGADFKVCCIRHCQPHVALRVMKDKGSRKAAIQMTREINLLQQIRHENIVSYLGEFNSPLYGRVEILKASDYDLFDYCNEHYYTVNDMHEWMAQLAHGLSYMHDRQIIHMDLGLNNLLISKSDDKYSIKIADWGDSEKAGSHIVVNEPFGAPETSSFWSEGRQLGSARVSKTQYISTAYDVWSYGYCVRNLTIYFAPDEHEEIRTAIHDLLSVKPEERYSAEALRLVSDLVNETRRAPCTKKRTRKEKRERFFCFVQDNPQDRVLMKRLLRAAIRAMTVDPVQRPDIRGIARLIDIEIEIETPLPGKVLPVFF